MNPITQIVQLFVDNLLPMFVIMGIGFVVHKRLSFDLQTLNRINLYVFVPAFLLDRLLHAELALSQALTVTLLAACSIVILLVVVRVVAGGLGLSATQRPAVALSAAFPNAGTYGLPLMGLCFGPAGVFVQSIIMMVNNLMVFSVGMYSVAKADSLRQTLTRFFRTPVPFAFLAAVLLRGLSWELPAGLDQSLSLLADGLVPIALLTLGAQLAAANWRAHRYPISVAVVGRLLVAPMLMTGLVLLASQLGLLEWGSVTAQVLIVAAAAPAAINTVIVSMEYDAEPEVAAGAILFGTLCSAVSVSVTLYLVT